MFRAQIFFISLLMLISESLAAQSYETEGETHELKLLFAGSLNIVDTLGTNLYFAEKVGYSLTRKITVYDTEELTFRSNELEPSLSKNHKLEHFFFLGGKLTCISNVVDKSTKKKYYYIREVDVNTLEWKGEWKEIGSYAINKKEQLMSSVFTLSKDNKSVFLRFLSPDSDEDDAVYMGRGNNYLKEAIYMGSEYNVIWRKKRIFPTDIRAYSSEETHVKDDGEVIMLGKRFASEKEFKTHRSSGGNNFNYEFVVVNEGEPKSHSLKLEDESHHIVSLSMRYFEGDKFFLSGLTSTHISGVPDGAISFLGNPKQGLFDSPTMKAFDFDVPYSIASDKSIKDKTEYVEGKPRSHISYSSWVYPKTSKGSFYTTVSRTSQSVGSSGVISESRLRGYYIFRTSPSGEIEWVRNLCYCNLYTFRAGHGRFFHVDNEELRVWYVDSDLNRETIGKDEDIKCMPSVGYRLELVKVRISENGEIVKESLDRSYLKNKFFMPYLFAELSDRLVFTAVVKKELVISTIKLEGKE